jgi:hypothetical protein
MISSRQAVTSRRHPEKAARGRNKKTPFKGARKQKPNRAKRRPNRGRKQAGQKRGQTCRPRETSGKKQAAALCVRVCERV